MNTEQLTTIAMIPARIGSSRLPMKNLALIDGEPMIAYAVRAAIESGVFDTVVINSDAPVFGEIAARLGVDFYQRPPHLGNSATKSDQVVYDFMRQFPADMVCWVNSISPLQTAEEIRSATNYFSANQLDSMITVNRQQVHANYANRPLNYLTDELFAQTQDLMPVELFVYSLMMWRTSTFMQAYEQKGYAFFEGKVGFFPVSKLSSIIVKRAEDLHLVECVIKARRDGDHTQVCYDPLAQEACYAI
jgi:CMP-N-acetylneuraminic acid synthetase